MRSETPSDWNRSDRTCKWCKALFTPTRSWQDFCVPKCRDAFHTAERREAIAAHRKHQATKAS